MSSRDKILNAVKNNQPAFREIPAMPGLPPAEPPAMPPAGKPLPMFPPATPAIIDRFMAVLESIGGAAYIVSGFDSITTILQEQHPGAKRIVSTCPEMTAWTETPDPGADPHTLEDIDLAILRAHFGVAENGACWITEDRMIHRALPFITQHLALVLDRHDIVADMHQAYDRIGALETAGASYGFASFIAGPSKTADIEQSLVLGAHGPRSMTVFLLDESISDAGFY